MHDAFIDLNRERIADPLAMPRISCLGIPPLQFRRTNLFVDRFNSASRKAARLEPATPSNIAFGIERLGFLGLRFPLLSVLIVALLAIGAAFGVERIKVDDSLSQLFRSDTPNSSNTRK